MPFILKGCLLITLFVLVNSQPQDHLNHNNRYDEGKHDPKDNFGPKQKGDKDQKENHRKYETEDKKKKQKDFTQDNPNNKQKDNDAENLNKQPKDQNPHPLKCPCKNQGICLSLQQTQEIFCSCNRSYIGKKCQRKAEEIWNSQQIFKFINIYKYKYFYYEPKGQNMLSFTFYMCFESKNYQNKTENKQLENSITFFFETQDENGGLNLTQQGNDPTTVEIKQNQCKYVTVDYTIFSQTKFKTYQKLILAIKLGKRLNQVTEEVPKELLTQQNRQDTKRKEVRKLQSIQYQIKSFPNDKNLSEINWTLNRKNTTYSSAGNKSFTAGSFRRVYMKFDVIAFQVNQVIKTIVHSLITITAFMIVAAMIFMLRTRIFGMRIAESLSSSTGLSNDLSYFDIYMPSERYIKQFDDQMRDHYHIGQLDRDCSICLGKIQSGQMIRRAPCNHIFHSQCLDSWCVQNLTCPMCRRSLTEIKMREFYDSSSQLASNSDSND